MKNTYLILTLMLLGSVAFGQELSPEAKRKIMQLRGAEFCGTATPSAQEVEATQQFIRNYQSKARNLRPSADPVYIPIKVHMVLNDAGDLPPLLLFNPRLFNESLAATNAIYKSANIQFYFTGTINYIKNTKLLDFNRRSSTDFTVDGFTYNADEDELCKAHEIPNAINLFLARTLRQDNGAAGVRLPAGYAQLPSTISISKYNTNRVFMDTQHFGGTSHLTDQTLTHELGHFLGLYHTHEPGFGKELVTRGTGANCSRAGDLVCDTPADPYSSLPAGSADFQTCGTFLSTLKDANGESYTTDKSNIMSYYSNYCLKGFTQGQFDRINTSLALRKTNSTYGKYDAPDTQVAPVTLLNAIVFNGGNVSLSVRDNADNETGYILERATSATGEFTAIKGYAANVTSFSDELFDIDTKNIPKLYYRVKASNSKNAYSSVWEVAVTPKKYCIPGINTKCEDDVRYLEFSTIKSTGTNLDETINPCLNPSNYAYLTKTIVMQTNSSYTIDGLMRYSINLPYDIYAYLDVNQNGLFDNNERIYFTDTKGASPTTKNFSFKLNTPTITGQYGVRIKAGNTSDVNADACSAMSWGETIDFTLNVLGPLSVKAGAIAKTSYCPNTQITVPFTVDGAATTSTQYTIQLSDNQGNNFKNLTTTVSGTNLNATIPAGTAAGSGYKIKVVSASPASESVSPTSLTVEALPTASIATATPNITAGNEAKLTLTFTGSAPHSYTLSDGKTGNATQSPIDVVVKPDKTTTYTIQSVNNACGAGTVSGSVVITVQAAPVLSISDAKFNGNTCLGSNVQVGFTQANFPTNSEYLALLSDNKGDFTKAVELLKTKETLFNIVIPTNTVVGSGYKIRVASVSNPDKFAETAAFNVSEKATATLSTTTPSITIGNEAKLTLTFTGSPSFNYLLSDGSKGDVSQNTVDVVIKPDKTTTYSIQTVSNACGAGAVSGSVEIKVETILSVNPINNQNIVTVYPNPTESRLKIDLKSLKTASNPAIIELFDMKGSSVRRIESSESSASLDIEDLGGGVYFLKIKSGKYVSTHKIIKR